MRGRTSADRKFGKEKEKENEKTESKSEAAHFALDAHFHFAHFAQAFGPATAGLGMGSGRDFAGSG